MRKILTLILLLAVGAGAYFHWFGLTDAGPPEPQNPIQYTSNETPPESKLEAVSEPILEIKEEKSLGARVFAFGKACATWGVGSKSAYVRADQLSDADFSSTPLTPAEIRDVRTEFAETFAARGADQQGIDLLREVIADEDDDLATLSGSDIAVELGYRSKIYERQAFRHDLLGSLLLNVERPLEAYESFKRARYFLSEIYGPQHPYLAVAFQNEIYAAEQAREAGVEVGNLGCDKQRLANLQGQALEADYLSQDEVYIPLPEAGGVDDNCPALISDFEDLESENLTIFFGTNRKATSSGNPKKMFGHRIGGLSLGMIDVTAPISEKVGAMPGQGLYDTASTYDVDHVVLNRVTKTGSSGEFSNLFSDWVGQSKSGKKEIFVYIHGHAESFKTATQRAAELAVEMDMRHGAAIFSWPAGQRVTLYTKSQKNARKSAKYLREYLQLLNTVDGVDKIHLIAHSMGNDVLTRALNDFDMEGYSAERRPFGQIFWASPDVAATDFANYTSRYKQQNLADGMTLYASSKDRALNVSSWLWDLKRAGQTPPVADVARVVPTIDTSHAYRDGIDLIAHSDYAGGAIEDIKARIWFDLTPGERCFLGADLVENVAYWSAGRGACNEEAFRSALSLSRVQHYAKLQPDFDVDQSIALVRRDVTLEDWETAQTLSGTISQLARQ